jgi:hypothetical protein
MQKGSAEISSKLRPASGAEALKRTDKDELAGD